jgi:hypothetical protein
MSVCLHSSLLIQHGNRTFSVLYYILTCGLSGCTIFSTLSHKWHDLLNVKGVFWYSLQHLPQTFLLLRRIHWGIIINLCRSLCQVCAFFHLILIKLEFSWQVFKKSSNIEFHENPSFGSQVVSWWSDGWMDRLDEAVTFHNFVNAPEN